MHNGTALSREQCLNVPYHNQAHLQLTVLLHNSLNSLN
jgi:hypothetical protein